MVAAEEALGRVRVPGGARLIAARAVAPLLRHDASLSVAVAFVELHRFWSVPVSQRAAVAFARKRLAAGLGGQLTGYGTAGDNSQQEDVLTVTIRPPGRGIYSDQVQLQVAAAGHGRSELRADVQVGWYPARSAAERVPADAPSVLVTGENGREAARTVTSPALIASLARRLNRLPARPDAGPFGCPMRVVSYRLTFAAAPGAGSPLVAAVSSCAGVTITAQGRRQPVLGGAGLAGLLQALARLLPAPGSSVPGPAGAGAPVPAAAG
jgi:hypothetical protein